MNTDFDMSEPSKLKCGELTEKIIGIFFQVYNELGHGFLESVYARSMQVALKEANLEVTREFAIPVWFRGQDVGEFRGDMLVENIVLLELKTVEVINRSHEAQLYNYLRATRFEVGLLLNFGPSPTFRRIVFDNQKKMIRVHPRSSVVGMQ